MNSSTDDLDYDINANLLTVSYLSYKTTGSEMSSQLKPQETADKPLDSHSVFDAAESKSVSLHYQSHGGYYNHNHTQCCKMVNSLNHLS